MIIKLRFSLNASNEFLEIDEVDKFDHNPNNPAQYYFTVDLAELNYNSIFHKLLSLHLVSGLIIN